MTVTEHDRDILRKLAVRKAEVAALPINREREMLWQRLNRLDPVRPMVWINEICWHEMDVDSQLVLRTSDHFCQGLERALRRELYQWNHMPADMIVSGTIACPIVVRDSGFGIAERSRKIYTSEGSVASRQFEPVIRKETDIQKIRMPELTVDRDETERRYEAMDGIFGDIMPVVRQGIPGRWFAPWDELIRWWGVQEAMVDLIERPELVHAAMERLVSAYLCRLDQWEELNLLALNNNNARVGSGGYGCTDELPADGFDPGNVRPRDLWGCATAQIFSDVSPPMHEEFALQYERRWLERWGLTYYGCCEPLHTKIGILKSVPNLRKISVSPWADLDSTVDQSEGRYVISFKPNPSILAEEMWNPDRAREHIREALEKTRGCAVEIIQKDISTVRLEPRRLWEWSDLALQVAEEFA